jgi:site-specific DNA recombinase
MKLVAYCRVSTESQRDNTSLEGQFERIKSYAQYHNFELSEYPALDVKSGTKYSRDGFFLALWRLRCTTCPPPAIGKNAAVEEIEGLLNEGCVCENPEGLDGIVAYDLDRLGRDARLLLWLRDFMERKGKQIHVLNGLGQCDTSSPHGKLAFTMFAGMAQFVRDDTVEKMARGRYDKARDKKYAGGRPPTGYRRSASGGLEIDPDRMQLFDWVCRMTRAGISYRKQAAMVNARGFRTRTGTKFDGAGIHCMAHKSTKSRLRKWEQSGRSYNYMNMTIKRLLRLGAVS